MFRKVLQVISLILLLFLLVDAFVFIDFAASRNDALAAKEKNEIENIRDIDTVEQKAMDYLDVIRRVHRDDSNRSALNFSLLCGLVLFQVLLLFNNRAKNKTK